jgi:hypothetical protein
MQAVLGAETYLCIGDLLALYCLKANMKEDNID